jgi:alkanesulfonate monooxygenase SsuD/methylene tetrahydromethanopterin reductase-like flavin-dependent oxidoreductase (luciferase family)
MEYAITFKPDMDPERIVNLTKQAEAAGFAYGWIFDSHVLWQEPYPLLTLMATNTERMRLGTCVTNPVVRDPTVTASLLATLNRISGGRMDHRHRARRQFAPRHGQEADDDRNLEESVAVISRSFSGKTDRIRRSSDPDDLG